MRLSRGALGGLMIGGCVAVGALFGTSRATAQSATRTTTGQAPRATAKTPSATTIIRESGDPAPRLAPAELTPVPRRGGVSLPFRFGFFGEPSHSPSPGPYVPRHLRTTRTNVAGSSVIVQEELLDGEALESPPAEAEDDLRIDIPVGEGLPTEDWQHAESWPAEAPCRDCCLIPCPPLDNLSVFAGGHGFKGPLNVGGAGSFGFHEGVNWGAPLGRRGCTGLGAQLGFQANHSNFSGNPFTEDMRNQIFVTGGVFRRADHGLQGGLVVDYLYDDWYYSLSLLQLRGELSWVLPHHYEWGVRFSANVDEDNEDISDLNFDFVSAEATDLFALFLRYRLDNCGGAELLFYSGFTGKSDGLIGADFDVPIMGPWSLETDVAYLIPKESRQGQGPFEESWNVAVNVVWTPHFCGRKCESRCYRPLFDVADNGSFMVDSNFEQRGG